MRSRRKRRRREGAANKGILAVSSLPLDGLNPRVGFASGWGSPLDGIGLWTGLPSGWGWPLDGVDLCMGLASGWGWPLYGDLPTPIVEGSIVCIKNLRMFANKNRPQPHTHTHTVYGVQSVYQLGLQ